MENLPTEVLEIVFCSLSKKEDIQKCYNTNSKWKHIIENVFANKTGEENFYFLYMRPKCYPSYYLLLQPMCDM